MVCMAKIQINKIEAARRQIVTAIELLFSGGDPVAIHTLVGADWRILRDLCEKQTTPQHLAFKGAIRPGMEKKFWTAMNSAVDFFKHADRDADAILEVDEAVNELVIMLAIKDFVDLGNRLSVEMIAFNTWCCFIMQTCSRLRFGRKSTTLSAKLTGRERRGQNSLNWAASF